jgi:hypothetical protein
MNQLMSCCGLLCNDCPAYQATVADDAILRKQTADKWSRIFRIEMKPEDINCLGCKSETVSGYCKVCKIRECNSEKSYQHCAECDSFACDQLTAFWKHAPEAKERLTKIRG